MKKTMKLGLISAVTAAMLVGCGGGNSDNGGGTGGGGTGGGGTGGGAANYTATFKAQSVGDQVEELMGGVIGIADEVGNGKMGDPMGADLAHADTTLVESQFSWNSTMDFYNNILSIKNVWDGGLKEIAEASQASQAATITTEIDEALALLVAISDFDGDLVLETADLTANNGSMAFRQQISDAAGRANIEAAQAKLLSLQHHLETLKTSIAPTAAELPLAAKVVDNVIVPGYTALGTEADKLVTALTALKNNPSAATVTAARDQWRATRAPWEAGEGHIFGPVDTLGVDPKVDSWPVNKNQLDGALGGYDPDLSNVDGFPVTMKGFHAMEYLLFGDGTVPESPADAATRLQTPVDGEPAADKVRLGYLEALGISFQKDIKSLVDAW